MTCMTGGSARHSVKWPSDNEHLKIDVYYPRDFANEYVWWSVCITPAITAKKRLIMGAGPIGILNSGRMVI